MKRLAILGPLAVSALVGFAAGIAVTLIQAAEEGLL